MEILYFHANAAQQLFVIKGIIEFHRKKKRLHQRVQPLRNPVT
jgi:hypothetical protein|tara:strand:- start:425 stop:553 length:129 start_codon:yes stop_codon:yes gene_type:complete